MKKLLFLFVFGFSFFASLGQISDAKTYIDSVVTANAANRITGPKLNTALTKIIENVVDSVYVSNDTLYWRLNGSWSNKKLNSSSSTLDDAVAAGNSTNKPFGKNDGSDLNAYLDGGDDGGVFIAKDNTGQDSVKYGAKGITFHQGEEFSQTYKPVVLSGNRIWYTPDKTDTALGKNDVPKVNVINATCIYYDTITNEFFIDTNCIKSLTGIGGADSSIFYTSFRADTSRRNLYDAITAAAIDPYRGMAQHQIPRGGGAGSSMSVNSNLSFNDNTLVLNDNDLNTLINAGHTTVTGNLNVGIGCFGTYALPNLTSGGRNVGVGPAALNSLQSGFYNIGLGEGAGQSNVSGSNNLNLGPYAGAFNTGSDQIFINVGSRGSYGNDTSLSPLWVKSNATLASQRIRLNGSVYLPVGAGAGKYLQSDANGLASWVDLSTTQLTAAKQTDTTNVTVSNSTNWFIVNPNVTISAQTLTMPASPTDGQEIVFSFGGLITASGISVVNTLTFAPNSGQGIIGATVFYSVEVDDAIIFKYNSTNSKWYRRR